MFNINAVSMWYMFRDNPLSDNALRQHLSEMIVTITAQKAGGANVMEHQVLWPIALVTWVQNNMYKQGTTKCTTKPLYT